MHHVAQPVDLRRAPGQVHEQLLRPAQELHPLEWAHGRARLDELVRRRAGGVHPAEIRIVEDLARWAVGVEGGPVGQRRALHLADHARLEHLEAAAPGVRIFAHLGLRAAGAFGGAIGHIRPGEIGGEARVERGQLGLAMARHAGQRPQLTRRAVGVLEGQRAQCTRSRGVMVMRSPPGTFCHELHEFCEGYRRW